jgi:hypothetical protein
LPGRLAFWPFLLIILDQFEITYQIFKENSLLIIFIIFIISLGIGFIIEDIASRLELNLLERRYIQNPKNKISKDFFYIVWDNYLTIEVEKDKEPILLRYYRSVLLRFKFELHICISLIIMLIGQLILRLIDHNVDWLRSFIYTLSIIGIIIFLHFEARKGVDLLHNKRIELLKHFRKYFTLPRSD